MRSFLLGALALALSSCSGLRGKAADLHAQGAFLEAVQTYEAALQQNPHDEESLSGLKKSRTAFLDKRLIEVRKARLATNRLLAIDILLEVVQLERQWDFFPGGPLANTQEEESVEALRFVEVQAMQSRTKERPLWGLYLLQHYQPIFSGSLASRRDFLLKEVATSGKKQCMGLARSESSKFPYFSEFVRKVCTAWGIPNQGSNHGAIGKKATLYRAIQVAPQISGLKPAHRSALNAALESAFQESPWYDAKGSLTLKLPLKGSFHLSHTRNPENRVHGYSVQVPFTDYQTVTKTRQVPYTAQFETCERNPENYRKICEPRSETRYRSENYTVQEPITRYQNTPRSLPYDGIAHEQTLQLHIEGELRLGDTVHPLRLDAQSFKSGFEHKWNMPNIGLAPERAHLEDPQVWMRYQADLLGTDLRAAAEDIWVDLYCKPMNSEPSLVATGDLVHRCLRQLHRTPPEFAESWYSRFMGLTVAQADEVLKLSDL